MQAVRAPAWGREEGGARGGCCGSFIQSSSKTPQEGFFQAFFGASPKHRKITHNSCPPTPVDTLRFQKRVPLLKTGGEFGGWGLIYQTFADALRKGWEVDTIFSCQNVFTLKVNQGGAWSDLGSPTQIPGCQPARCCQRQAVTASRDRP